MSSRRLELVKDARRDIRDLLRFTLRRWGTEQARAYEARLLDAMERLVDFPELGVERPTAGKGVRAFRVEEHMIYYRVTTASVRILRVMHRNQPTEGPAVPPFFAWNPPVVAGWV